MSDKKIVTNEDVVTEIKYHEKISEENRGRVARWGIGIILTIAITGVSVTSKVSRDFGQLEASVENNTTAITKQDDALKDLKRDVHIKQRENKEAVLREIDDIKRQQRDINEKLDKIIERL